MKIRLFSGFIDMSFRQMRVFVMFDLPTDTALDRREYRVFRKYLMDTGFIMIQESVYTKLCLNGSSAKTIYQNVRKHKPAKGLVQMLTVTEKQYANIEYLVGTSGGEYLNSIDPLVII